MLIWVFFFFFLIWVFVLVGFWWAVGNGGGDWVVWLLRDGHRGRDRNERERERSDR